MVVILFKQTEIIFVFLYHKFIFKLGINATISTTLKYWGGSRNRSEPSHVRTARAKSYWKTRIWQPLWLRHSCYQR